MRFKYYMVWWLRLKENLTWYLIYTLWLNHFIFQEAAAANATITQPLQQHAPLSRAGQQAASNKSSLPNAKNNGGESASDMADILVTQFRKCLTTNLVVRLNNFTLWRVSTSKVKVAPKEFLSGTQFERHYNLTELTASQVSRCKFLA